MAADDSDAKPTRPDSDESQSFTPPPGPPRKGIWGFFASFFPKDHPIAPDTSSAESSDPVQHDTPDDPQGAAQSKSEASGDDADGKPLDVKEPAKDLDEAPAPNEPNEPLQDAPGVNEAQVPQTEEESADLEGEKAPPTVGVGDEVKAATTEGNEDKPPTLPTEPEGSGGSEEDTSTPDPGESYDPKKQ